MRAAVAALLRFRGSPFDTRWSRAMASSAKKRVLPSGQGQVVAQVGGRLADVHGRDGEPGDDALVQGGKGAVPLAPHDFQGVWNYTINAQSDAA